MTKPRAEPKRANAAADAGVKAVETYLAKVPEPARRTLERMRATIRAAAPKGATEGISCGMPAFKYKKPLAGYAAFKATAAYFR